MCLSTVAIKLNSFLVRTMWVFARTVTYVCTYKIIIINCIYAIVYALQKLYEMMFDFLRIICNHEHFIPLNLPFAVKGNMI